MWVNEFRTNICFHFGCYKREILPVHVFPFFDARQKIDQRVKINANLNFGQILSGIRFFRYFYRIQSVDYERNLKTGNFCI